MWWIALYLVWSGLFVAFDLTGWWVFAQIGMVATVLLLAPVIHLASREQAQRELLAVYYQLVKADHPETVEAVEAQHRLAAFERQKAGLLKSLFVRFFPKREG